MTVEAEPQQQETRRATCQTCGQRVPELVTVPITKEDESSIFSQVMLFDRAVVALDAGDGSGAWYVEVTPASADPRD